MITFVVPTIGRESLAKTLQSIVCWYGDEILLVGDSWRVNDRRVRYVDCKPGRDWGATERNFATSFVKTPYIAHIDDDDVYAPGTRELMENALQKTPAKPVLFRMRFPNGITLWQEPEVRCGNVGTPMMLIPNIPEKLGTWGSFVGGDCHFLETMQWGRNEIVWRPEVIALLGHNT